MSRWSAAGLALVAGVAIYLAVTVGRFYPGRAAAWVLMAFTALWVCRRLRAQYRSGSAIAAHPFRWRASYASCLSVLGVAFASAPILLTPAGAPDAMAMQAMALVLVGGFGAALCHSAHLNSAFALAAPAAAMPLLAALRAENLAGATAIAALSGVGAVGLLLFHRAVAGNLRQRNPRTALLRAEIDATARAADSEAERRAAAR